MRHIKFDGTSTSKPGLRQYSSRSVDTFMYKIWGSDILALSISVLSTWYVLDTNDIIHMQNTDVSIASFVFLTSEPRLTPIVDLPGDENTFLGF